MAVLKCVKVMRCSLLKSYIQHYGHSKEHKAKIIIDILELSLKGTPNVLKRKRNIAFVNYYVELRGSKKEIDISVFLKTDISISDISTDTSFRLLGIPCNAQKTTNSFELVFSN